MRPSWRLPNICTSTAVSRNGVCAAPRARALIVNLEKQPRPSRPSYFRTLPAAAATEDLMPTAETLKDAYELAKGGK